MATEVILPKVDMDMAEGRVSRWLVAEGAIVKRGEPIFEIETDKAAMEVEAPASGTLGQIVAGEGVVVPVGKPVAWIFSEGEKPGSAIAEAAMSAPSAQRSTAPADAAPLMELKSIFVAKAVPGELRATPLARRLARAAGLSLAEIQGSGPYGRITRADVERFAAAPTKEAEAAQPAAAVVPSGADVRSLFVEGSFTEIPHDSMRKTIARRLSEAKSTIPHFYVSADCRLDKLLALRAAANDSAPKSNGAISYKLSINDFVIKAWALALRDVPMANVSWADAAMLQHAHADIGVAVSIPGGLITPIIRAAESKSLSAISNEMKDLASRAKARKLKPEEYNGGSSAISNLGMFGVRDFAAIVNPPHATILAVGSGEQRPVVENGAVIAAAVMTVTLSTDHRAVDGALAAEALAAFKRYVEEPAAMLV
jgi:pyruvate dehydrogenase E2 component (dihydrolipoamide acetyltransferase)